MITIITGARGVGKTTMLLKLVEEIKNTEISPSGIMTPALYNEDNDKVGFYVLNVANGEQWELGRSDKPLDGPSYVSFSFNGRGFIRANKILKKVLTEGSTDVFLDEVGPLELEKGYGFFPILSLISNFDLNHNLYIVIRPELIDEFVKQFIPEREYKVIRITLENRDDFNMFKKMY
ncbi:MAG: hypothetical protein PF693_12350 [Spirochaetia bacterium]|jgi:nucleoside-triphosphatase THEP1|nr:hypothetical protein [Spirochaetia bacterium]